MAGDIYTTVVGNLTADPELRFTQNGLAVANFTVAQTPRSFDKNTGEWKDGETTFMRCSVWRDVAEHVAKSLVKGSGVIAAGRLVSKSYETKPTDGSAPQKRSSVELEVEHVGASLQYATAVLTRTSKTAPDTAGDGFLPSSGKRVA